MLGLVPAGEMILGRSVLGRGTEKGSPSSKGRHRSSHFSLRACSNKSSSVSSAVLAALDGGDNSTVTFSSSPWGEIWWGFMLLCFLDVMLRASDFAMERVQVEDVWK